ncbi:hypothetical protein GIB67_032007, partial [Kingdonia uniflora]
YLKLMDDHDLFGISSSLNLLVDIDIPLNGNQWVAITNPICCLIVIGCKDGGTPCSISFGFTGSFVALSVLITHK